MVKYSHVLNLEGERITRRAVLGLSPLSRDTDYRQVQLNNDKIKAIREYGLTGDRVRCKIPLKSHKEEPVKSEVKMRNNNKKYKRDLYRAQSGGGAYCAVQGIERAGARIHFGKDEDLLDQTNEGGIR